MNCVRDPLRLDRDSLPSTGMGDWDRPPSCAHPRAQWAGRADIAAHLAAKANHSRQAAMLSLRRRLLWYALWVAVLAGDGVDVVYALGREEGGVHFLDLDSAVGIGGMARVA
jgi:hypothetical protein